MTFFKPYALSFSLKKIKSFFWPTGGIKKACQDFFLKLVRLQDSPSAIALGFAFGVGISFTPFLGGHILLTLACSWIFKFNKVSSLLGTLIGTPWTLPFMIFMSYKTGLKLNGLLIQLFPSLPLSSDIISQPFNLKNLYDHPGDFFFPTLIGSLPIGVLSGGVAFILIFSAIKSYRKEHGLPL